MALSWPLSAASINFATTGDNTLVAGVAGQIITVYKIFLVVTTTAVALTFKDGTAGTALTGAITPTPGTPLIFQFETTPWFFASPGNNFVLNQSGTSQVSGRIYYSQR